MNNNLSPISWKNVNIDGGLLKQRQDVNAAVTVPHIYGKCNQTGRIDALKIKLQKQNKTVDPHPFWDSDIGKMIEAVAYSLTIKPNGELEDKVDEIIDMLEAEQHEDDYLNTYYTLTGIENRWTNMYYMHELYCAGHLIEGAVAYYLATGKSKYLNIMCKYADYIYDTFGREEGKIKGYCGHPEIELALVKLYRVTKDKKYYDLAKYFVEERGQKPYFFEIESLKRGVDLTKTANQKRHLKYFLKSRGPFAEYQAHKPVREQEIPVGHAVRAMYLYCAMADIAKEDNDKSMLEACERLFKVVTKTQLSIIGGIGPAGDGERFTFAYDIPNEYTYNEACASVGLVMWSHRMLQITGDSKYADIMEQVLYNSVLSSVSMDGNKFFYSNYLTVYPDRFNHASATMIDKTRAERQEWFDVSCCPPNVSRLIGSIGQYIYSQTQDRVYIHLYNDSNTIISIGGEDVKISQKTNYPWDKEVKIQISLSSRAQFKLYVRCPDWCNLYSILVNGEKTDYSIEKGYFVIDRTWSDSDSVDIVLEMPVQKIQAHPAVRENCCKIAVKRGPVIYCLEEIDNGKYLNDVCVNLDEKIEAKFGHDTLGDIVWLEFNGFRRGNYNTEELYMPAVNNKQSVKLGAVPYFSWGHRGFGEMVVWINAE